MAFVSFNFFLYKEIKKPGLWSRAGAWQWGFGIYRNNNYVLGGFFRS